MTRVTHVPVYHVVVNLWLAEPPADAGEAGQGVEYVQRLVQSRLEGSGVRVAHVRVYGAVDKD